MSPQRAQPRRCRSPRCDDTIDVWPIIGLCWACRASWALGLRHGGYILVAAGVAAKLFGWWL